MTDEPRTYDEAVEMVHRAFCDPQHELVGEWDRSMADALRRNGYEIRADSADTLDAAWKAAEAATDGLLYLAAKPDGRFVAGTDSGAPADSYAYGPTPTAALQALTARLATGSEATPTDSGASS